MLNWNLLRKGRQTMIANRDEKNPASADKIMLEMFYSGWQTMHLLASREGVVDLGATTTPRTPDAPRLPCPRIAQRGTKGCLIHAAFVFLINSVRSSRVTMVASCLFARA